MSSKSDSSVTAHKTVKLILQENYVQIEGSSFFSVSIADPKLNASELYKAVFQEMAEPTIISVTASQEVLADPIAKAIYESTKTIIDEAVTTINAKLQESGDNISDSESLPEKSTKA